MSENSMWWVPRAGLLVDHHRMMKVSSGYHPSYFVGGAPLFGAVLGRCQGTDGSMNPSASAHDGPPGRPHHLIEDTLPQKGWKWMVWPRFRTMKSAHPNKWFSLTPLP